MGTTKLSGATACIVEDDLLLSKQVQAVLEEQGMDAYRVGTIEEARRLLEKEPFDFVLLDICLPDGNGLDLLRKNVIPPDTITVVMTAENQVETAVEAMRLGAADYLAKPFNPMELPLVLRRALTAKRASREREYIQTGKPEEEEFIFGPSMESVRRQLERIVAADRRVIGTPPPVVLVGETGTGKTSLARWIHAHGPRAGKPFLEVNCATLPENLAESELFGHERGAFTDARTRRMGLFEAADGGTLFLDELPSLTLSLQAKLLTAIEEGQIRRLGSTRTIPVDVRLIVASQRPFQELVAQGKLREDLYHRLNLFQITLPPLRERREDILLLAERFLQKICAKYRLPPKRISPRGRERLLRYPWPGNVRELLHEIERTVVFTESEELEFEQLPVPAMEPTPQPSDSEPAGSSETDWFNPRFVFPPSGFSLEAAIQRLIRHALNQTGGNVSAAARLLGVSRDYVRYRLGLKKTASPSQPEKEF